MKWAWVLFGAVFGLYDIVLTVYVCNDAFHVLGGRNKECVLPLHVSTSMCLWFYDSGHYAQCEWNSSVVLNGGSPQDVELAQRPWCVLRFVFLLLLLLLAREFTAHGHFPTHERLFHNGCGVFLLCLCFMGVSMPVNPVCTKYATCAKCAFDLWCCWHFVRDAWKICQSFPERQPLGLFCSRRDALKSFLVSERVVRGYSGMNHTITLIYMCT